MQDVPIIGIAITVVAGFHNDFPCKLVLFPEQPRNLRLHLVKGKGIEHGGEIAHQFIGVVADLPDVVAVFVIAGVIFLRLVNVDLQVRLHFRVIQIRITNILLIGHVGRGDIGGLEPGEHSGTGGHAGGEKHHHHSQQGDNRQQRLVCRRILLDSPGDLPGGVHHIPRVLGRLLGLMRGLGIFPLDLLFLYPLHQRVFLPQFGIVPEGGLPRQIQILLCRPLLRLTQGEVGLGAAAVLPPPERPSYALLGK